MLTIAREKISEGEFRTEHGVSSSEDDEFQSIETEVNNYQINKKKERQKSVNYNFEERSLSYSENEKWRTMGTTEQS